MNREEIEAFQEQSKKLFSFLESRWNIIADARGFTKVTAEYLKISEDGDIVLADYEGESIHLFDNFDLYSDDELYKKTYKEIRTTRLFSESLIIDQKAEKERIATEARELLELKRLQEKYKDQLNADE